MLFDLTDKLAHELSLDLPEADGALSFAVRGDFEVEICPVDGDSLVISAPVRSAAQIDQALLVRLLAGSAFGRETGGAAFGLDTARDEIVLWRELPTTSLTYEEFGAAIAAFLEALEAWRRRSRETDDDAEAGPPDGMIHPGLHV